MLYDSHAELGYLSLVYVSSVPKVTVWPVKSGTYHTIHGTPMSSSGRICCQPGRGTTANLGPRAAFSSCGINSVKYNSNIL